MSMNVECQNVTYLTNTDLYTGRVSTVIKLLPINQSNTVVAGRALGVRRLNGLQPPEA